MKRRTSVRHIGIILLLLILLPAIFYSAYEIGSLTSSEEMLDEVYSRQLDAILFSINQFAWDVVNSWTGTITKILVKNEKTRQEQLTTLLAQNPPVKAIFFADSNGSNIEVLGRGSSDGHVKALRLSLTQNSEKIKRLYRYEKTDYQKLEPIYLGDSSAASVETALMFVSGAREHNTMAGIVLNDSVFVGDIIGRKLTDVAGNEFILSVLQRRTGRVVFTTSGAQVEDLKQRKPLWLFPDFELGIRLKGTTVEEVVRARAYRNIVLIIVLDLVLLAGAWFVYRTLRRELDLVRLKSNFISNVSHELRTPLALIRMFGETLEMGRVPTEDRKKEYYSTIVNESERLSRLVNNILDFSRMEAGRKQYSFRNTNLNDVVSHVLRTYSYHLQAEGFAPVVELLPSLPEVNADPEAVTEAVINLVDNAIKYSEVEKYLRVFTSVENKSIVIGVEDHGPGIAEEHHKKIFETFYRVSTGLVHNTKGSGLGLSLVQHIMDAHKGNVRVRSTVGKGSTFELEFPVQSDH